jgi:outer membrane protein OmpA-like peptidoglycan-associated protein
MVRTPRIASRSTVRHFAMAAAVLMAALAGTASAQEVRQYQATDTVDPSDVAHILAPAAGAPKMRSLRILDAAQTPGAADRRSGIEEPEPSVSDETRASALTLPVQFAFDSARILPQARPQLDAVAAGIKLLPDDRRVVIEGHTDSVGSAAYNLELSERRALAVKTYLVAAHGIDSGRLLTEGFGPYRPINPADSAAAENRRVQFRGQ